MKLNYFRFNMGKLENLFQDAGMSDSDKTVLKKNYLAFTITDRLNKR